MTYRSRVLLDGVLAFALDMEDKKLADDVNGLPIDILSTLYSRELSSDNLHTHLATHLINFFGVLRREMKALPLDELVAFLREYPDSDMRFVSPDLPAFSMFKVYHKMMDAPGLRDYSLMDQVYAQLRAQEHKEGDSLSKSERNRKFHSLEFSLRQEDWHWAAFLQEIIPESEIKSSSFPLNMWSLAQEEAMRLTPYFTLAVDTIEDGYHQSSGTTTLTVLQPVFELVRRIKAENWTKPEE